MDLINFDKSTLIIGDMNICLMERPQNKLSMFLKSKSFSQIVMSATNIHGGYIDHAYIMNKGNYQDEPKYYSDHDALCISWKKK